MGLIKATGKLLARTFNDAFHNKQQKKSHKRAYQQTGEQMRKAKQKGKRVNGKKLYRTNLKEYQRNTEQNRTNIDKFIGDL